MKEYWFSPCVLTEDHVRVTKSEHTSHGCITCLSLVPQLIGIGQDCWVSAEQGCTIVVVVSLTTVMADRVISSNEIRQPLWTTIKASFHSTHYPLVQEHFHVLNDRFWRTHPSSLTHITHTQVQCGYIGRNVWLDHGHVSPARQVCGFHCIQYCA